MFDLHVAVIKTVHKKNPIFAYANEGQKRGWQLLVHSWAVTARAWRRAGLLGQEAQA